MRNIIRLALSATYQFSFQYNSVCLGDVVEDPQDQGREMDS